MTLNMKEKHVRDQITEKESLKFVAMEGSLKR